MHCPLLSRELTNFISIGHCTDLYTINRERVLAGANIETGFIYGFSFQPMNSIDPMGSGALRH